jgi:CheY-like chemotaxis protein
MPRVLVIDDDQAVANTVRLLMEADGYSVVMAGDGAAGMKEIEAGSFDLAIIDIFMPGMDGLKTIRAIRQQNRKTPIIAVSGMMPSAASGPALDGLSVALNFEAVVCLRKPFQPSELRQTARRLIASATLGKEPVQPAARAATTEAATTS